MFGLKNHRGSCWVNACLQGVFRIPELQQRYTKLDADPKNTIDVCLQTIYNSNGENGIRDFFECVKTEYLPAGNDIGDSDELLQHLCDKLPFLDKLCRFKIANTVECITCKAKELKEDTVIEFELHPEKHLMPISECISMVVSPSVIPDWKCEKCKKLGCSKQLFIGSFPKVMTFHMTSINTSIDYSSVLILNKKKYALLAVVCYNGSHWWTYGREMPPGTDWYTFDDKNIINHGPSQFPVSKAMRLLIYYRLEE